MSAINQVNTTEEVEELGRKVEMRNLMETQTALGSDREQRETKFYLRQKVV